jgi:thioredoxin-related protein
MLLLGAALVSLSPALADAPRDASTAFFQQSFGDLSDELVTARDEGKMGVFVMFDDKDCPWCAKMKATVLNQPEVQDYYRKHFRILQIDKNGDGMLIDFSGNETIEKAFADKNRVRATPVIVFYDLNGDTMVRFTGAARNVEEFMWLGEFVVDGHYKNSKFPVYKRQKKAQSEQKS